MTHERDQIIDDIIVQVTKSDEPGISEALERAEDLATTAKLKELLGAVASAEASLESAVHLCGGEPSDEDIFQLGYAAAVFKLSLEVRRHIIKVAPLKPTGDGD
jgi:hypothetical protein